MSDTIHSRNTEKYETYKLLFRQRFGRNLRKYIHPLFGFDLVLFEDDLQVPDEVSIEEHVRAVYGESAVKLIETLIGVEEKKKEEA